MDLKIDAKIEIKLIALSKMALEIWRFLTTALESLKIRTLMGFFYPKQKTYELKITGELCVVTMKMQNLKRNRLVISKLT